MLKFGTNNIGKLYLGGNVIGKAYYGSNLVYSAGLPPTPPGDYSGFTNGKQINYSNGELIDLEGYCVSPYIAIPSGTQYLSFNILDSSLVIPKIAIYDSSKAFLAYWNQNTIYRTVKLANYQNAAFVRFSEKIETRGQEFIRVRDDSFNQSNVFQGPNYHTGYDDVIFGCMRELNNNPPTENLTKTTTVLFYVDTSTQSIQFGATDSNSGNLLMYDDSQTYIGYYGSATNPRTITDARWSTTWRYLAKNCDVGDLDGQFIKNLTTDSYLFKAKNVE